VAYAHSRACGRADLFADDPQCWRIMGTEKGPLEIIKEIS